MNNIDLEKVKKLIKTKKDEEDVKGFELLIEATETRDFSKYEKFVSNRVQKNRMRDLRKNNPKEFYFIWLKRVVLFPLFIVIIIDNVIKYFNAKYSSK